MKLFGRKPLSPAQAELVFTRRALVLGGSQFAVGGLLAARMAYLAIADHEKYATLSESNRVSLSLIPPRRGWIVDRTGAPLASNRTTFRVDVVRDRLADRRGALDFLQRTLGFDADERQRIEDDLDDAAGFAPVQVAENVAWDKYAAVTIRAPDLPGVQPSQGFARFYPDGAAVGHLVGYVGAASAKDYAQSKDPLLITPGYKIGKDALEKTLEPALKGVPGARRSEVTARGKLVRDLETRADVPGRTVHLTIDAGLQAFAARRLGPNSGALTVIDCATGEILALVSMPCFDPNSFSDGIGRREYQALTEDDHLPLRNKALQGLYPPGSTVKPMNAMALLGQGVDPNATVSCGGAFRVGAGLFHCWKRGGHGAVNMHRAVEQSCDVYFYAMAQRLGYQPFADTARAVGLGQRFELPFASQSFGTVPDPAWKQRRFKQDWSVYDSINASIGQGYMLVNPFQLAVMAARLATGRALVPTLFKGAAKPAAALPVTPEHLAFVHDAMSAVVNGNGTAGSARLPLPDVKLAGKTGTAQVRRITLAERAGGVRGDAALPFKLRDHSLFIGFAPHDRPRYAVACILEHSGHIVTAAPMASDALLYLFDRDKALAKLTALEASWGGDLATRMAAKAATYDEAAAAQAAAPPANAAADVPDAPPAPQRVDER